MRRPSIGDIHQHRRGRIVEVPDVVVDRLEMPHPLAGLDVEREDAGAEQVVAGPEAAEEVDRRRIGRNVDEPARRIGRHRRPRRHVAGPLPRVVLPRLVAELAGPRNDVELPQVLAALGVVGEDVARDVLDARLVVALLVHVADDDDAVDDDRRRRGGEVAEFARDALVGVVLVARCQPRAPSPCTRSGSMSTTPLAGNPGSGTRVPQFVQVLAGLGVERVQEERGRRVDR